MNDLISIIIPVYNVENYIEKCMNTIINQTYKNIEVLLIDDGSTDSSPKLIENIRKSDKRIKTYHKKNGGLSDARNYGIKKAKGKYLVFIDSDDWVDLNYIEYLYNLIKKNNCDISICEIVKITDCGKIVSRNYNNNSIVIMNQKEAIRNMIEVKYFATSACGKMYKKECFDNVLFPVGRLFEDIPTNYNIFLSIDKIVFGAKGLYYYLTREGSITRNDFSEKHMDSIFFIEEAMKNVIKKYPEFKKNSETRIFLAYFDIWKSFRRKDEKNEYYNITKENVKKMRLSIIKNHESKRIVRIKATLTYLPISVVRILFNIMKK